MLVFHCQIFPEVVVNKMVVVTKLYFLRGDCEESFLVQKPKKRGTKTYTGFAGLVIVKCV